MYAFSERRAQKIREAITWLTSGAQLLVLLPLLCLLGYLVAGEVALVVIALAVPMIRLLSGLAHGRPELPPSRARDAVTGLTLRDSLEAMLDGALQTQASSTLRTACVMIQIDEFDAFSDRYGPNASDDVLYRVAGRLRSAMRDDDLICKAGHATFGIGMAPATHMDLEAMIQLAARLQQMVEEPIALDSTTVYISCSIGFCLGSRSPMPTGAALLAASQGALQEALRYAPSAIRAFSTEMLRGKRGRALRVEEVAAALEKGQIVPFFQPQVSTDTGLVTGFEALARWCHPDRGMIAPAEFLPLIEQGGLIERLGDAMLVQSLTALTQWDAAGLQVPQVGVNFSMEELMNPRLMEKLQWQLDRFGLAPSRLSVEVLENVVAASPEDVVARNINGLAKLGCRIDLDDFGTGHASISSIRRFAVERLKIDRSFVMKVDCDAEQQRMVAAILTMAERLGLATLAEGVETPGEHAMLAQLGCDHVQGFEIARPMPFEQTTEWIRAYHAGLTEAPKFGRGNA
ncbi:phosphodiesterase [Pseudooceanicola sp. CBS1P-1]|uniref:EAL domain-containing protein n=1 Tax=Pseudooceanicola albus TaxID=2692189 RepID=A0A6L7G618_9RHOB|nr:MULTISPECIES: phosphodiesterase [Pseudooceanicola]MBT9384893.1 phosphodiesterase [Pseudooceanicola endophyticus]MXN18113.1 EAL domain-containing protein [Pseudooceanicola albus]